MPKKNLKERIIDADYRGNYWLAEGNRYQEAGEKDKAEVCYRKSQFWLDRYNLLSGASDRTPPKE
jgi:hypothetical protein